MCSHCIDLEPRIYMFRRRESTMLQYSLQKVHLSLSSVVAENYDDSSSWTETVLTCLPPTPTLLIHIIYRACTQNIPLDVVHDEEFSKAPLPSFSAFFNSRRLTKFFGGLSQE